QETLQWHPVEQASQVMYEAMGNGVTFWTSPLAEPLEITGPVAAKLFIASSTYDADMFLTLRVFDPDGQEVLFNGAMDPRTPVSQGWLRASHRKLDPELTREYRPYHTHDERQPLVPGEVYELDIELWPTSLVIPAGYRLALTVQGKDYENCERGLVVFGKEMRGSGTFWHDDPVDRPEEVFANQVTLYTGGVHGAYLLLPVIPAEG
ncbi:MAG: hypothetical protein K6T31_01845, partial [Alicyclobacillus sp.]|nr:hypothetical protein [Alicyclobacillus sp.]